MPQTEVQQNLVEKNRQYATYFRQGHLALPPAKKYAVVTCMDARIDPVNAYGINLGDAHVIRNAGGSAKEALRSLVISQQLLGTNEVLVIKHTGCGMLTFSNSDAWSIVKKNLGKEAAAEVNHSLPTPDWLPFPDLDDAVRKDVTFLKSSKAIPGDVVISGWVYEVESGRVRHVV